MSNILCLDNTESMPRIMIMMRVLPPRLFNRFYCDPGLARHGRKAVIVFSLGRALLVVAAEADGELYSADGAIV